MRAGQREGETADPSLWGADSADPTTLRLPALPIVLTTVTSGKAFAGVHHTEVNSGAVSVALRAQRPAYF